MRLLPQLPTAPSKNKQALEILRYLYSFLEESAVPVLPMLQKGISVLLHLSAAKSYNVTISAIAWSTT